MRKGLRGVLSGSSAIVRRRTAIKTATAGHSDGIQLQLQLQLQKRVRYRSPPFWLASDYHRRQQPLSTSAAAAGRRSVRIGGHVQKDDGTSQTTIYALSTPPGKSAIAVIRISGPACLDIFKSLCPSTPLPKPRVASLRTLYKPSPPVKAPSQSSSAHEPISQEILDPGALILYFPSPKSFTGEDSLELHIHGGPAVIRAVLSSIPECIPPPYSLKQQQKQQSPVIRYAEPGEFTRRAFTNDRLTLPQIEALADTLSATTEQQRLMSVRSSTSSLAARYESWRKRLIEARGELEALIDFSEDQQFDSGSGELLVNVIFAVEELKEEMELHVANAVKGELLRNGISLTLLGAPNAGKSSLLNKIVDREAAIVSQEAGTTRDVVDLSVDLGGYMVVLGDTAGLRVGDIGDSSNNGQIIGEVEKEGIKRAKNRVLEGDIAIVVLSIEKVNGKPELKISQEVVKVAEEAIKGNEEEGVFGKEVVVVINKMDLLQDMVIPEKYIDKIHSHLPSLPPGRIFGISCALSTTSNPKESGIQNFLNGLISIFKQMTSPITPPPDDTATTTTATITNWQDSIGTTQRQRLLLEECIRCLDRFLETSPSDLDQTDPPFSSSSPESGEKEKEQKREQEEEVDVVIAAEELRFAANCLAKINGKFTEGSGDVEEVLGVVFEKFCVGK